MSHQEHFFLEHMPVVFTSPKSAVRTKANPISYRTIIHTAENKKMELRPGQILATTDFGGSKTPNKMDMATYLTSSGNNFLASIDALMTDPPKIMDYLFSWEKLISQETENNPHGATDLPDFQLMPDDVRITDGLCRCSDQPQDSNCQNFYRETENNLHGATELPDFQLEPDDFRITDGLCCDQPLDSNCQNLAESLSTKTNAPAFDDPKTNASANTNDRERSYCLTSSEVKFAPKAKHVKNRTKETKTSRGGKTESLSSKFGRVIRSKYVKFRKMRRTKYNKEAMEEFQDQHHQGRKLNQSMKPKFPYMLRSKSLLINSIESPEKQATESSQTMTPKSSYMLRSFSHTTYDRI